MNEQTFLTGLIGATGLPITTYEGLSFYQVVMKGHLPGDTRLVYLGVMTLYENGKIYITKEEFERKFFLYSPSLMRDLREFLTVILTHENILPREEKTA